MSPTLAEFILKRPFGFITSAELPELIRLDRLCPLVVRCGCCRFICGAQDLETLSGYVKAGGDYVRDVAVQPDTILAARECIAAAPCPPKFKVSRKIVRAAKDTLSQNCADAVANYAQEFNEADCGGAFDGNQVTSDADPGL